MRTLITWMCVILALCSGGLVVSDALSWERWVAPVQVAGEAVLAQERRPAMSPVLRSRFARPVPRGWAAPSLVGARRGAPPLAGSVGRAFASLQVPAVAVGMPVQTVGSLAERTCESKALPLPKAILVKEVQEVVHKPCDRKLFGGVWNCDITCGIGGCGPMDVVTLEREVDRDGYQVISWQESHLENEPWKTVWKVDRQWYPSTPGDIYAGGRLVGVTCNGTNSHGNAKLTVNYKKPDGSDRGKTNFSIKENGTMYIEAYRVWHKDGKVLRDLLMRRSCYRTYEREP